MGVIGDTEKQVPFRLFEVYIRYHSPRPNLIIMESINLSIINFKSRRKQTAAQTKVFGCIVVVFLVFSSSSFLDVILLPF